MQVLEAVYRLDLPGDRWRVGMLRALQPRLGGGLGATAIDYAVGGDRPRIESLFMDPGLIPEMDVYGAADGASTGGLSSVFSSVPSMSTISSRLRDAQDAALFRRRLGRHDIFDVAYLAGVDEGGGGLFLGYPMPNARRPQGTSRAHWGRVALHLSAVLRLRRALGGPPRPDDAAAVFSPDGRVLHAAPALRERGVLEALRQRALETAKLGVAARRRRLDLWPCLVQGRWSVVDSFDRDGRRFLLVLENPARGSRLRALTEREAQVVEGVARGQSNKAIAYALGLADGTVSATLREACRKLGVRRRTQLIALSKLARKAVVGPVEGTDTRATALGLAGTPPAPLSPSERLVLDLVGRGLSNEEVARARGTSARTVANQIASILRKTGCGSRYELVAAQATHPGG